MAHAVIEMLGSKYKAIYMQRILKKNIIITTTQTKRFVKTIISNINHSVLSHINEYHEITEIS